MTKGESILGKEFTGKRGDAFWRLLLQVAEKSERQRIPKKVAARADDPMPGWDVSTAEWMTIPRNVRTFIWWRLTEHERERHP